MRIGRVKPEDYGRVRDFYYELIDAMAGDRFNPGWERDVYPTREFLRSSIEKGELFVGEEDGKILASMVVNHDYNEGYRKASWPVNALDDQVYVIHALGVHPEFFGRGIAKAMVREVIHMAGENGMRALRLDVLEGNLPAEKSYTAVGFRYVDTVRMFYEDTGWTNYKLYEYSIH